MSDGDNDDFKRLDPCGGPGLLDGSADRVRRDVPRIQDFPDADWYVDRSAGRCYLIDRQSLESFLEDARAVEEPRATGEALQRIFDRDVDLFRTIFGYETPSEYIAESGITPADLELPWDPDLLNTFEPFPMFRMCGGYWEEDFPSELLDLLVESAISYEKFVDVYLPIKAFDIAIERLRGTGATVVEVPNRIFELAYLFVHGGSLA